MTAKTKTMDITLNRTIPASPAEVYDAWLDTDNPGTPWHDSSKLIFDPKPKLDGMFYFNKVSKERTGRTSVASPPSNEASRFSTAGCRSSRAGSNRW